MAGPSRIAAALDYLERLRAQADQASTQTQLQAAKVARDFAGGVGQNLANRARDLGQMGYEAFTSAPSTPQTTAEFAELASQRQPTPMLDATAQGLGQFGKALVTDPIGTGRAMVSGELERARTASTSPEAAGEYAGSFIDPMRIAKTLKKMPSVNRITQTPEKMPSAFEQKLRELYGDFAQAYNLGLPDTPEYRRIVQEVTAQGPLSDDALREAIGAHPAYVQASGKTAATELRQSKRNGAAALVDSLSEQGVKTRVETSKSLGSRSTYIYASKGDKTVKIRLSDHLPAESGRVYGTNDIMTTPQHWKAATKRALQLLEETE